VKQSKKVGLHKMPKPAQQVEKQNKGRKREKERGFTFPWETRRRKVWNYFAKEKERETAYKQPSEQRS